MNKVIVVPDSFKGTLSSSEACAIISEGIRRFYPHAEIISVPVADGGEGSVEAFLEASGGSRVRLVVKGPYMEDIESFYGLLDNGETAVIEMAACAGLVLAGDEPDVKKATTYGVGQMISDAAARGCKKVIVGLGGSATNDFGAGAAAASGVKFTDGDGIEFIPSGGTLSRIAHIDTSGMPDNIKALELVAMCDIDNPLYGENGAAYVFAPQKGASPETVEFLDGQLRAAADTVKRELGTNVSTLPGSGAAGGMGGGMAAFFGARLTMGIEAVLDAVCFDKLLDGADLVISGEGRIDFQSLRGKTVIGAARRTKKKNVPLIVLAGDVCDGIDDVYSEGVSAVFSINQKAVPLGEAKARTKENLLFTVENLMRFLSISGY